MRTLVQGGLVVRHDGVRRADVLFEDERIVEVGEGLSASGACVVDATDCYVLPGGVDAQVRPAGAGLGGLARAALLGGTTSLGVLPPCDGSTPVTDGLPLDVVVHADAAGELPDAAACAAFPASLLTAADACTRLRGLKNQGMLPLAACGLEPVVRGMRARLEAEGQRDVQIWPQVFPAYAEETAVRLALTLAHAAESPLCLGPVSSARALTALSGGHDCGRIHACTASTCTMVRLLRRLTSAARCSTSFRVPTSLFTIMQATRMVFLPTCSSISLMSSVPSARGFTTVTL